MIDQVLPFKYKSFIFKLLLLGADKTAAVFNKDDEQVVAILKGHSKKVNRVIYHPNGENNVITASYDGTIRIWDVPTSQVRAKYSIENSFLPSIFGKRPLTLIVVNLK